MADNLFSPSWYRVAELKPRLRRHAEIHRHEYRGRVWYILQDHAGGRSHRFTPAAYRFIGLMDGERRVQELWDAVNAQAGDVAPTQDEAIRLLGQLHAADALICDVPPDSRELFRRFKRHQRLQWKQRLWSPLAIRLPLLDPQRFLERTFPCVRFLFSVWGGILWLSVVATGVILAGVHWDELTENIVDRTLTPQNLLLLWLVYPVVKALHELWHGYATILSGGEVHEMGIMFLVLVPVPYVDVSSAWGFRDKYRRIVVGAAGIAVELFLGAVALFVWLSVEPGAVHAVAYNVMLISGVSTLLFNGNPLLRFDGYYVLVDLLEIPNLGTRSNKYLGYLIQRYLFGVRDAESPTDSLGESIWFVVYGIAAFFYRMFIMFVIILYIGGKFFAVGVLLAIWAVSTQIIIPMSKKISFLFTSHRLRSRRGRSFGISLLLVGIILALLFLVPAPLWTRTEGVTWPSEKSQVRAGVDGFVVELLAVAGKHVHQGQDLIRSHDPFLQARVKILLAQLKGLRSQLAAAQTRDRVRTSVIREELAIVRANLARVQEQAAELVIRSPRAGIFVVPQAQDIAGQFIYKGQLVGYVVEPSDLVTVRAVVSQDEIGLVRKHTRKVDVMPAEWGSEPYQASIQREVPGGTNLLPTAALGLSGGGTFAVDPLDSQGRRTLERVFEIEVALPEGAPVRYLGSRMYVRFDHGYEPLGIQLYRSLRQLFLRQFSV